MLKVPYFTFQNYQPIMGKSFEENSSQIWYDFGTLLKIFSDQFITDYKQVYSLRLGDYINEVQLPGTVQLGSNDEISTEDYLTYLKLLMPTLWTCEYFYWNVGEGKHHGIDIMLPKGTPLPSFLDGQVVRIKEWNGTSKNEGNCIVIKGELDGEEYYICYEHMDTINVSNGEKLKMGDIIGTAGTTGNSTQYHLHFQVDKNTAPFHPFYSSARNIDEIKSNTIDPIKFLRKVYKIDNPSFSVNDNTQPPKEDVSSVDKATPTEDNSRSSESVILDIMDKIEDMEETPKSVSQPEQNVPVSTESTNTNTASPETTTEEDLIGKLMDSIEDTQESIFIDMPSEEKYQLAMSFLYNNEIIKGYEGRIFPDDMLKRYEFALLVYRVITKMNLLNLVEGKQENEVFDYTDVDYDDPELKLALDFLQKYSIMKGKDDKFLPGNMLKGEEVLAVLGRLFYGLNDSTGNDWYENYENYFVENSFILQNWRFVGKEINRKEVFYLLSLMLNQ